MGIVKAIWEPFVCRAKPSVQLKKIASWHTFRFLQKETGAESVAMATT